MHVGYIGHNSERHDLICRYCSFGADGAGGHPAVQLHPRTAPVCDDKKKMNLICQTTSLMVLSAHCHVITLSIFSTINSTDLYMICMDTG